MTDAERRRRNRARVAQRYGDLAPPPGLTGAELTYSKVMAGNAGRVVSSEQRAAVARKHPWRKLGGGLPK